MDTAGLDPLLRLRREGAAMTYESHHEADDTRAECETCWQAWPCDAFRLLSERATLQAKVERVEAERDRHGPCICNHGPGTEGPDEFCPRHVEGRPFASRGSSRHD
jgi:hypothetical protein